jgi:MFS family permease
MVEARSVAGAWRSVLADGEFRGLWLAQALSLAGDQLARVAVAVLVFDRTNSAFFTAAAYSVSLLPWLIGGPLLGGLGDRFPRRAVMVGCDLASAVLVVAMVLPGLGLPALYGLIFLLILVAAPFSSARAALIRDVFPDGRYAGAIALGNVTGQTAQVVGFGIGGALVAAIGPTEALGLDAVTFALSALIVRLAVLGRPAAQRPGVATAAGPVAGLRLVLRDRRLRRLTAYAWLAAFHVAPSGVVVPYAARHGGGPVAVGGLLAVSALGTAAGMVALTQWADQDRRVALMPALAVAAAAPFLLSVLDPGLALTGLLWFVAGLGSAYQLGANVAFVSAVPNALRAQAFGIVSAGLVAGQGLAILAAGALAEVLAPHLVVAAFGAAGTAAALALAAGRRQGRAPVTG